LVMKRLLVTAGLAMVLLGHMLGTTGCRPDKSDWLSADAVSSKRAAQIAPSMTDEEFFRAKTMSSRLSEEDSKRVLATIGNREITLGEFEKRYQALPEALRYHFTSRQRMEEFLDHVVTYEALAIEAWGEASRDGWSAETYREPRVLFATKLAMVKDMLRRESQTLAPISPVTEDDIRKEYEDNPDSYRTPSRIRLSILTTHERQDAERLRGQILQKDDRAEAFRAAVRQHSVHEESRDRAGDVGYVTEGTRQGDDAELAGALLRAGLSIESVGGLSEVVEVGTRFHFLMVTEKTGGVALGRKESSAATRNKLLAERQEKAIAEYVADLRSKATVEIDKSAFARFMESRDDAETK